MLTYGPNEARKGLSKYVKVWYALFKFMLEHVKCEAFEKVTGNERLGISNSFSFKILQVALPNRQRRHGVNTQYIFKIPIYQIYENFNFHNLVAKSYNLLCLFVMETA